MKKSENKNLLKLVSWSCLDLWNSE